jgi:hypothetical protein
LENGIAIAIVKHFFGYGVVKELAKKAKRTDKESANNRKNAQLKIDGVKFNEWHIRVLDLFYSKHGDLLEKVKFTDVGGVKGEQELKFKDANQKKPPKFKLWDRFLISDLLGNEKVCHIVGVEPSGFYLLTDSDGVRCCEVDLEDGGSYETLSDNVRVKRYSEKELAVVGRLYPYRYIVLE